MPSEQSEDLLDLLIEEEEEFDWQAHGLKLIGDGCYQKFRVNPKY
jgi:hypothetical protein